MTRGRLYIQRRVGEAFVIGHAVKVTVTKIRAGQVEVEVDAPVELPVLRQELIARPPRKVAP